MSKSRKPQTDPVPEVERRAPDQDAAVEAAFVEGILPEEDRREPVVVPEPVVSVAPEAPVPEPAGTGVRSIEDRVEVGGQIERTASGWKVHLMYGGVRRLHGEGTTIDAALTAASA